MQSSLMRLHGTKNVGYIVELLRWSHKMDLIALSNDKGEVVVQRLNLQILWVQQPPTENAKVRGIDWRPDEHILAVGYNTGKVLLIDVENQQIIHTLNLHSDIACVSWTQNTTESYDDFDDLQGNTKLFANGHKVYLPQLPNFNSLTSNTRKVDYNCHTPYATRVLNILMVAQKSGTVNLFVFGMLPCGQINVKSALGTTRTDDLQIYDIKMSKDFHTVFVWVRHKRKLRQLAFQNPIYSECTIPLLKLATQYGYIVNTLAYIDEIIQCIIEAWETALLEMDRKLTKYVNTRPDGVVSADFLELLMFGYAPDNLVRFLTRDLTDKGMKKLGNSIEVSYSTIQQLVIRPLHTAILNISYHLNYLKGMSKNTYYYKDLLGTISSEASLNAGAFLIKSLELQQVIEQSNRDYKIFWGWLYGVIVRLNDETVPDDVAAVSQQDVMYLAEFLNTFDQYCEIDNENRFKRKFNLERVGQYLQNQNLQNPSRVSVMSDWNKLLEQSEALKNSDCIYPHHKEMSLVQEHSNLKESIHKLFTKPDTMISLKFQLAYCIDVSDLNDDTKFYMHHVDIDENGAALFAATVNNEIIYLVEFTPKSDFIKFGRFEFVQEETPVEGGSLQKYPKSKLLHSQFYNEKTLSMLLEYKQDQQNTNGFIQFPVETMQQRMLGSRLRSRIFLDQSLVTINLCELLDPNLMRPLEMHDGYLLAVSGGRKMSTILSKSKRKLRHYEMEIDEDDIMDQDDYDTKKNETGEGDDENGDDDNNDNEVEMNETEESKSGSYVTVKSSFDRSISTVDDRSGIDESIGSSIVMSPVSDDSEGRSMVRSVF